jgi:hypothetical protein
MHEPPRCCLPLDLKILRKSDGRRGVKAKQFRNGKGVERGMPSVAVAISYILSLYYIAGL